MIFTKRICVGPDVHVFLAGGNKALVSGVFTCHDKAHRELRSLDNTIIIAVVGLEIDIVSGFNDRILECFHLFLSGLLIIIVIDFPAIGLLSVQRHMNDTVVHQVKGVCIATHIICAGLLCRREGELSKGHIIIVLLYGIFSCEYLCIPIVGINIGLSVKTDYDHDKRQICVCFSFTGPSRCLPHGIRRKTDLPV